MSPARPKKESPMAKQLARAIAAADRDACFGPSFFAHHLGALVRERCPTPEERMGIVELYLASGEVLELCHIVSLTPKWAVFAVFAGPAGRRDGAAMRTELVPYGAIARVGIRSEVRADGRIGFGQASPPALALERPAAAEELLRRARR